MKKRLVISLFLITFFLQSCSILKNYSLISLIYSTEATYDDYSNGKKTIRFVNMVHIGTKEFYTDVANKVKDAKNNNYVLFYEFIDIDKASDLEKRKMRKLTGLFPTPEGYKKYLADHFEDDSLMAQDNDQFLNLVNDKDYNVDISLTELINQYEIKYGEIILDKKDIETPIIEEITTTLPEEKTKPILLDYRNKYLATKVENSKFSKIIILYGADHNKGFLNELRGLNSEWKKN